MEPFWDAPTDGTILGCPKRWTLLGVPQEMDPFNDAPRDRHFSGFLKRWAHFGVPQGHYPASEQSWKLLSSPDLPGGLVQPCPGHHARLGHQGRDTAAGDTRAAVLTPVPQRWPSPSLLGIPAAQKCSFTATSLTGGLMGHREMELLYGWAGTDPSHGSVFTLLTHPESQDPKSPSSSGELEHRNPR